MKTVFTITTEHDGLIGECFTNIKALFTFLNNELNINDGQINPYDTDRPIKYSYTNLVKEIKLNQTNSRFFVVDIYNHGIGRITVNQLYVTSK